MAGNLQPDNFTRHAWHALSSEKTLREVQSREEGLNQEEARQRQEKFGPNKLPEKKRAGLALVFLRQFKNPLIYVLLIAGVVSVAIGSQKDAIFIFAVLLINSVIGTFQEWKAESSAEALQHAIKTIAKVRRSGQRQEVDAVELVPGDILVLESGDAIPADLRLLSAKGLRVDESLLTGESDPVQKNPQADLAEDMPLAERQTLLHAGTAVVDGRATGVVCRTGAATEVGRIAESLGQEAAAPPLVIRLEQFTRAIAYVILAAVVVLGAVQLYQGTELSQVFILAVALAVSAIPAGLPVAITVALSIGTQRMAQRHVIVRQLPAVEGLGACTLIASDKTGTLTANKLTVKRIVLKDSQTVTVGGEGLKPEGEITLDGNPITDVDIETALRRLAISGMLCNEGELVIQEDGQVRQAGDAVDVAFLVLAAKNGLQQEKAQHDYPQAGFIPFESQRRYAASFNREKDKMVAHVKGAAETVIPMCRGIDPDTVMAQQESLAGDGYRVLAVASGEVETDQSEAEDEGTLHDLDFLGLVGIIDPIRPEVPEAIERCHRAGVEVRMITGDHPSTGRAIAKQLGLRSDEKSVLTGAEFAELEQNEDTLAKNIKDAAVFARVEPGQKTTIVNALKRLQHFVAVTGDGVNDAPALKAANIGVAMGKSGTDVARGAADLILTDDNFASIVNGIEEGRIAYSNVRKVTWLLISTGAAEVVLFFFALCTGLPLPLDPVQLLWLNLVTNGVQDVALAFEKGEAGLLDRPPRPPDQPIFDRLMIEETVVSGTFMGLVAFGTFYWLFQYSGYSEFESRNLLLLLMVLFENIHIFNCRSESRSFYHIPLRANPLLIIAVVVAQGVHILAMHVPILRSTLEVEPVAFMHWVTLLGMALSILLVMEMYKHLRGRELARTWR
jgi:Ca2+-transporting ATPase